MFCPRCGGTCSPDGAGEDVPQPTPPDYWFGCERQVIRDSDLRVDLPHRPARDVGRGRVDDESALRDAADFIGQSLWCLSVALLALLWLWALCGV